MISDFPLFMFTVLVGLASGAYIAAAVFPQKDAEKERPWAFPLIMLVMVAIGGVAAFMHLGRPELAYNMVGNLASPLMLEGIAAGVLAIVALIDLVLSIKKPEHVRLARIIGGVVGVASLASMTYAYSVSYGSLAWASTPTLFVFIVGGLVGGMSLWTVLSGQQAKGMALAVGALAAVFTCVLIWQAATFAGLGADGSACIGIGAAFAAASAVMAFAQPRIKTKAEVLMLAAAVLSIIAVIVSRYGFYMASII